MGTAGNAKRAALSRAIRWPNEPPSRHASAENEEFLPFDETLTTGLEDTVRNLKALPDREKEAQHWQEKAIDEAKDEIKKLRKELGNVVRALDKKASIINQGKFEKSLSDRMDGRIDKIRNIAMWAIGIMLVADGLIKVVR